MRFINSFRNSAAALLGQLITIVLGMVVRWFFVHSLGEEYLGVNSVMESMLMILSMTELGIGTSVAFALYKPIADDDKPRIGSLMAFYRKVYWAIGLFTATAGLLMIPFMKFFTREAENVADLHIIYLLFLANTVLSYFFAYKRTLISAYQKNYINSVTEDTVAIVKYILQICVLYFFKSYIGYILISVICALVTNAIISAFCDRDYGYIKQYRNEKLLQEDKDSLKKSVVSLMYQKIGAKLVTGTDNLMISYAKLTLMGIYSNYAMIISIASRVVYNVLHSILGSIGNLMVDDNSEHKRNVYEEFVFADFCLHFFIALGLSACLERFIVLWAGDEWLLSPLITFVVILNFYLNGMRQPNVVIIEAAGLFNKLRMKAVAEVIVNLVVSLLFLLVFKFGIYGVLFGTTVSMVSVCIWWETSAVHKYALDGASTGRFIINYLIYLATTFCGCFATYFASKALPVDGIAGLILSGIIAVGVFAVIILVVFSRTKNFKKLVERFLKKG